MPRTKLPAVSPEDAKSLADGAYQAITTKYLGATDSRDARVIARCEARRITISWDHALDVRANHAAAALALFRALGWDRYTTLVMGGLGGAEYVFVQVPK